MSVNRINFTINSRVYTVVADENVEYIRGLCEYVNEKVNMVLREGNHVMGEKPIVLAALNICDEYFKLLGENESVEKMSEVMAENKALREELKELKSEHAKLVKTSVHTEEDLELTQGILEETEEKVKFLEGQIVLKESQIKKQRGEFALREKELLDMLDPA